TVVFDPSAMGLDPMNTHTYNFTTINIGAGVTVLLRASVLGEARPVVWLASGAVTIAGTINLNGANGHDTAGPAVPAIAGAGGYNGGAGAVGGINTAQAGNGPGGGRLLASSHGSGGGFATAGTGGGPGGAYGNPLLLPLIGGSGGSGGGPGAF